MPVRALANDNIQGIGSVEDCFSRLKIGLNDLLDMCDEPITEVKAIRQMDANLDFLKGYYELLETLTKEADESNSTRMDTAVLD